MHGSGVNLAPKGSRADELVRFVGVFKAGVGFFFSFPSYASVELCLRSAYL